MDPNVENEIRKAMAFQKMAKAAVANNKVEEAKKFMANYYGCMEGIYNQNMSDVRMTMALAMASGTMAQFYSYDLMADSNTAVENIQTAYRYAKISKDLNGQLYESHPENLQWAKGYLLSLWTLYSLSRMTNPTETTLKNSVETLLTKLEREHPEDEYIQQFKKNIADKGQ
jgi:hypothetical protein